MSKVLITGGTGFIGSHTAVELLEAGYDVDIIDNLSNSKASVIDAIEKITEKRPSFHQIDMLDADALSNLFSRSKYEYVLHFAGLKAVGESVEKPLLYYRVNVGGALNLIASMREHGACNLIFSSSATVYGKQDSPRCVESMKTGCGITNPYGRTKYMIEEIIKDTCASDPSFSAVILRYFNPVGNHPSGLIGEDPSGIPNNIMPVITRVAKGLLPKLSVFGNDYDTPDGTCRRDYIHVVDLARGHLAAMRHMLPGASVYNLGTGKPSSVLELIDAFQTASGCSIPYEFAPRRAGDLPECWADPSLANRELGWKAELSVSDAMRDTLKFLKMNK